MSFAIDEVASRIGAIRFDDLPDHVVRKVEIAILNYIAGSLLGFDSPVSFAEKRMWDFLCCMDGGCTIIGHEGKYGVLAAASVNATMGQYIFQEDCHEQSISHPGVGIIPAVLAVAQQYHLSGEKVIEAVVCGYEAQGLIGRGLVLDGFALNGLRPASVVGVFGSSAAVAVLLGLNPGLIATSLSIAGNLAAGVMEFSNTGTDDICIQNCYVAKNGIQAAFEAKNGLKGAPSIIDGRFGLSHAFLHGKDFDTTVFWGKHFEIEDTFVKRYPFCGHVLLVAQAITDICQRYRPVPSDIDKVEVRVSHMGKTFPGCDNPGPFSGIVSAMMSHQFAVASAIINGKPDEESVRKYSDSAITALAKRISILEDKNSKAQVTVYMTDGAVLSSVQHDVDYLSDDEVIERMRKNGKRCFSDERIEKIISLVLELDQLDDVGKAFGLLESETA